MWLGIDIGGTKTEVLLVDNDLSVCSRAARPTDTRGPEKLVAAVKQITGRALETAGSSFEDLVAAGVAVPGLVDPERGLVELAVNLNLDRYDLAAALSAAFGRPCFLENDARTAAMGAYEWLNHRRPVRHLAYLSIGTGIAAGVILDGRLYRGANGMAGEIGHAILEPGGPPCRCGLQGCLETLAAGPAIARMATGQLPDRDDGRPPAAEDVYRLAGQGHTAARAIVRRVSAVYAQAIQLLVMTYDVDAVILGGGVSSAGAAFLDPILDELAHLRDASALAQKLLPDEKVLLLPAGFNAGLWGAIHLARRQTDVNLA